jgi:dipeptidyl aminopeptidase/acylaminoacyl peptidase
VKLVTYKARDGLPIEAVVTTPKGREARKLPVIVMPHGGPWRMTRWITTIGRNFWRARAIW